MFIIQLDFKGVLTNSTKQVLKSLEYLSIFLSNAMAKCVLRVWFVTSLKMPVQMHISTPLRCFSKVFVLKLCSEIYHF